MGQEIEKLLGLDKEDIKQRKHIILSSLPQKLGLKYLGTRLKQFEVQPWPFIIYLAYENPKLFEDYFNKYKNYAGAINSIPIMERLRDFYIMTTLLLEGEKIEKDN